MATGNFYAHENGIYALRELSFADALEDLKEQLGEDEEITDEMVLDHMHDHAEWELDCFWETLRHYLPKHLELDPKGLWDATVYNLGGKWWRS